MKSKDPYFWVIQNTKTKKFWSISHTWITNFNRKNVKESINTYLNKNNCDFIIGQYLNKNIAKAVPVYLTLK